LWKCQQVDAETPKQLPNTKGECEGLFLQSAAISKLAVIT
jgi:hypothetical protein